MNEEGVYLMVKKSKKLFSLLLALVMALTSFVVPLSVSAATNDLTVASDKFGVIVSGDSNVRWDTTNNTLTVCNDGGDTNTTAGVWTFPLNVDKELTVEKASITINWTGATESEYLFQNGELDFMFTNGANVDGYVAANGAPGGKYTKNVGWGAGVGNSFRTNLGVIETFTVTAKKVNKQATIDLMPVITHARANGWSSIALVIMINNLWVGNNGNGGEDWSDCKFGFNQSMSLTTSDTVYTYEGMKELMKDFESKINGSSIYTNMAPAYEAYVEANKLVDAYEYGNVDSQSESFINKMKTASINLRDTVANMSALEAKDASAHATYSGDTSAWSSDAQYAQTNKNVLWAAKAVNPAVNTNAVARTENIDIENDSGWIKNNAYQDSLIIHPSAVLLYDGSGNDIYFPVLYNLYLNAGDVGINYDVYHVSLENSPSFSLKNSAWKGHLNVNSDVQRLLLDSTVANTLSSSAVEAATYHITDTSQNYFANLLQFTPASDFFTDSDGMKYVEKAPALTWRFRGRQTNDVNKAVTENGNAPIYVVNYKDVSVAISNAKSELISLFKSSKQGELTDLMAAMDKVTAIDPQDDVKYNYLSNTEAALTQFNTDMTNAMTTLDSAAAKADLGYQALRDIMDTARDAYANSAEMRANTHTWVSVDAFTAAYEAAVAKMATYENNDYDNNSDAIVSLTQNLTDAYNNLELRADLTTTKNLWHQLLELLVNLEGDPARFLTKDINTVIKDIELYESLGHPTEEQEFNTGIKKNEAIKIANENLQSDIDALMYGEGIDLSALNAVADILANIDADIYTDKAYEDAMLIYSALESNPIEFTYDDEVLGQKTIQIPALKDSVDKDTVDSYVTKLLESLNSHLVEYDVTVSSAVTVNGGYNGEPAEDVANGTKTYKADYGTKLTMTAPVEDTAWYLSYTSMTTGRDIAYQAQGGNYELRVIGSLDITTQSRNEDNSEVRILRMYDNGDRHLTSVSYVSGSYSLPEGKPIPNYNFNGYTVNGEAKNAGDIITISEDTTVYANYTYSADTFVVSVNNGEIKENSYKYDEKIKLEAAEGMCWAEEVNGQLRPYWGSNKAVHFVADNTTFVAVTSEVYQNLIDGKGVFNTRPSGAMDANGDTLLTGQFVLPDGAVLKEAGYLIALPASGETVNEDDVRLENINKIDATLLRVKATKPTTSNQFAVRIKGGIKGLNTCSKGYLIYTIGSYTYTVYSDAVTVE